MLMKKEVIEDNKRLKKKLEELKEDNDYLKLSKPEQNVEHFRVVRENKRKIDCLRKQNKDLREQLSKEKQAYINMYNMYDEEKKKNDKAIEYVEMAKVIEEGNTLQQITNYERNILKILKGVDKE